MMSLGSAISGLFGLIGGIANTQQVNATNLHIARETNKANRELVEMQNKAAKEEAELAYKRSSAPNQVALMQSAGMSRAGAINALNGGGSYTPAPVNTSQDSAPQIQTADLSGVANIAQALAQRSQQKHDEKMQSKQLAAVKEQQQAQLESNERIAQLQADSSRYGADTAAGTARDRLDFDKKVYDDAAPLRRRQLQELDSRIKNLDAVTNNYKTQTALLDLRYELESDNLEVSKLRNLADNLSSIASSQLNALKSSLVHQSLLSMDKEMLADYMHYKARMELVAMLANGIKEEEWDKPNAERISKTLQFIESFVVKR